MADVSLEHRSLGEGNITSNIPVEVSPFYMHSGKVPLASRISFHVRRSTFELFMKVMQPQKHHRILDIGVTSDESHGESNFFEQFYPDKNQITCVGTEDGSALIKKYPGISFKQVTAGEPLPFRDQEFDIAFSNAVIEHVGSESAQADFVREACRVAKRIFITTPNRWFPVEHHTGIPLLHYLPKAWFRAALSRTPLSYWAKEENLNSLSLQSFKRCFPKNLPVEISRVGVGFGVFRSNLVGFSANSL